VKLAPISICAITLPGHDPPVAWRVPSAWDPTMPVITCPTISGWALISPIARDALAVLEAEPGRSPVRP
jgi:hypothetical protein